MFSVPLPDDAVGLPLTEAIRQLRIQILAAMKEAESEDLQFIMGPIEIELTLALETRRNANGGIATWVVKASGGRESARHETHRVTITLTPRRGGGNDGREIPLNGYDPR